MMNGERGCSDDADPTLVQLITMAIGAMKYALPPAFMQTRYRWQIVRHTCGDDEPSARLALSSVNLDLEGIDGAADICCETIDPVDRLIGLDLAPGLGNDLAWRFSILTEKAVRVAGKAVAAACPHR